MTPKRKKHRERGSCTIGRNGLVISDTKKYADNNQKHGCFGNKKWRLK